MVLLFLVIDHLSLLFTFPNQDYQIAAWVINQLELMKLSYIFWTSYYNYKLQIRAGAC